MAAQSMDAQSERVAILDKHLARMPHHSAVSHFVNEQATPEQVSLLHRLVDHLRTSGMPFVKGLLDAHPEIVDCAQEHGFCAATPKCLQNGKYIILFGDPEKGSIRHEVMPDQMPYSCNVPIFGSDPVPGQSKRCWIDCAKPIDAVINRVDSCPAPVTDGSVGNTKHWALIPSCSNEKQSKPEEAVYQEAIKGFCANPGHAVGMKSWLDCNFLPSYRLAVGAPADWDGRPTHDQWIDRAWVCLYARPSAHPYAPQANLHIHTSARTYTHTYRCCITLSSLRCLTAWHGMAWYCTAGDLL